MSGLIKRTLAAHEDIIEAGVKSFLDVGNSLMAIRDERLFEKDYDNFEQYCSKKWGFKRAYAYDLIESAVVIHDLSAIADTKTDILPGNEAQARAVADSAPDAKTRAVVWEAAVESAPKDDGGNPVMTAAIVKKAAARIVGKKKAKPKKKAAPKADAEPVDREPGQDEPEPEHKPDPKRPTDKSGNALPDRPELLKAFSAHDLFHSTEAARNVIQNNCLAIALLIPDGTAFREHIDKALKGVFHLIESYRPAYVCKSCAGGRCSRCLKRGYTTWQSR